MKRILVTGAGGAPGSNFVDCLRMAGEEFYIIGCDSSEYHLELAGNLDGKYLVPRADDPCYLEELRKLIEHEKIDFLHPQPDVEVLAIAGNIQSLDVKTFLPDFSTIELCQDKSGFNARLREAGVPVPVSYRLESREDLELAFRSLTAGERTQEKAWIRAVQGAGSRGSLPIYDVDQGHQWIDFWHSSRGLSYEDFMLSEFLPGREFAFQSLWKDGAIVTSQARERLEYLFGNLTPSGQSSSPSVARTSHDETVNRNASQAVESVDGKAGGVFCVDLKENCAGIPCVTEINCGRFFTTSNFFASAGSNMPYSYLKLAFGEKLPPLPRFNAVEAGLYWIRGIDMGFKLVRDGEWTSRKI